MSKKLKSMELEIKRHADAYYSGEPIISDREFDKLLEEFKAAGGKEVVGHGHVPTGKTVKHLKPMLSLTKRREAEDVVSFVESSSSDKGVVVFEPKWDGLAIEIASIDGKIVASTRGDGINGVDVTSRAKMAKNYAALSKNKSAVYGEVVILRSDFVQLNELREENNKTPYANLRNAASGILLGNDLGNYARFLTIIPHEVDSLDKSVRKTVELPTYKRRHLPLSDVAEGDLHKTVEEVIEQFANPDDLAPDVLTDGMVIKLYEGDSLKSAIAYKFEDRIQEAVADEVVWSVGRTGVLTPVLKLRDKVQFPLSKVDSITLSNYAKFLSLSPNKGDAVGISMAHQVIPFINWCDSSNPVKAPSLCPSCGGETYISESGAELYCSNMCNSVGMIDNFLTKLGVEGVRAATIEGYCNSLDEEYQDYSWLDKGLWMIFDASVDDLLLIDGFKETKAKNTRKALDAALDASNANMLAALGIEEIGNTLSSKIIKHFDGSIIALRDHIAEVISGEAEFEKIEGVGPKRAELLCQESTLDDLNEIIFQFTNYFDEIEPDSYEIASGSEDSKFFNKNVVVTGSIPGMKRSEAQDALRALGATIQSSVSKTTDILVAGDNTGATKMSKAEALGTRILTGVEFLEEINN